MTTLENWLVTQYFDSGIYVLMGDAYGDPRFDDGANVRTSPLKAINFDERRAVTHNTIYNLGTPAGGTRMKPAVDEDTQIAKGIS